MVLEIKSKDKKNSLTYSIQNFVVKSHLFFEQELDLTLLKNKIINSQYEPNRFPGLFIRFRNPKCVIILFRNGKLILTGLKSSNNIKLVINRLISDLNNIETIKLVEEKINTEIVNIVVTANLFKEINLDEATIKLSNTIYEPEVFPGLIYKSRTSPKFVFLIFSTGKIVLTGIRDEDKIEPILTHLGRLLIKEDLFKKN